MYDEQIEVFVGEPDVSARICALAIFFVDCFEYSVNVEYSVVEISAGPVWITGNLMYISRRANSKIRNLIKLKGCDAKK